MIPTKNKYIITGCGRSGTGFLSKLFNDNGIKCGHESYYTVNNRGQLYEAESSWLATPHINEFKDKKIIRLIRNPVSVIKSFLDYS